MNSSKTGTNARAVVAQRIGMAAIYLAAAGVVFWSAMAAKRSQAVPALAALDVVSTASVERAGAIVDPLGSRVPAQQHSDSVEAEFQFVESTPIDTELRYFNGRAVRPVKTMWMTVTGYSPDERSCGKWADGITASNKSVWTNAMQLVAADTRLLPFGSLLSIEGYAGDQIVPVEDRGGAIKGMRLDLLYPTHEEALQWGVRHMPVTVWEYVED